MSSNNNPHSSSTPESTAEADMDLEGLVEDVNQSAMSDAAENMNDEQIRQLCLEKICPDCPELAKARDEKLRMAAETENLKKRLQREKEDFCKYATESVLEDLLPVLDNLDLALEHGRKSGAGQELINGVEMTRKLFLDILTRHSLDPLGEPGEDFDPAWHEALAQQPDPTMEPGKVCQVVQKGYRLKGRLLRPAKVLVSTACDA